MILSPEWLSLSKSEKEYAIKQLITKKRRICLSINSYKKYSCIVRLKEGVSHYKVREELRKTAYNLKKTIKSHDQSELVITLIILIMGLLQISLKGSC